MTLINAIKKINREGYEVEHVLGNLNRLFRVNLTDRKEVLEFYAGEADNDAIHCIGVKRATDESDPMTDYCAFSFYNNLSQALSK